MHKFSWLVCSTGVLESVHASQFSVVDRCLSVILRAYQLLSPSSEFKSVSLLGLVAIELTHGLFVSLLKVNCQQSKQEPARSHTHTWDVLADEFVICVSLFPFSLQASPCLFIAKSLSVPFLLYREARETAGVMCVWSHCNHWNIRFTCSQIAVKSRFFV